MGYCAQSTSSRFKYISHGNVRYSVRYFAPRSVHFARVKLYIAAQSAAKKKSRIDINTLCRRDYGGRSWSNTQYQMRTAYVVCTCCSQVPCLQIYTQQEDTHSCGPSSGLPLLRALPGPRWVRRKKSPLPSDVSPLFCIFFHARENVFRSFPKAS